MNLEYIGNILYDKQLCEGHSIVVYGAKGASKRIFRFLENNDCKNSIRCVCDKNSELWGTQLEGIEILSPMEAVRKYKSAIFLVCGNFANEMIDVLIELGVKRIHLLLLN